VDEMSTSRFFGADDATTMASVVPRPGTSSRVANFDEVEFRINSFDVDAVVPPHEHEFHSVIFVLSGRIKVSLDTAEADLEPGQGVYAEAGARHGLRALGEGARVVDLWWPVRPEEKD
jgi:quercetin dioxygenase-like cupin family protein